MQKVLEYEMVYITSGIWRVSGKRNFLTKRYHIFSGTKLQVLFDKIQLKQHKDHSTTFLYNSVSALNLDTHLMYGQHCLQ